MGGTLSYMTTEKDWYVYRRRIDTDGYDNAPFHQWKNINPTTALARFKHEVYAYSLFKYNYDSNTKAIYLYHGSTRVCRAGIVSNQIIVRCPNTEMLKNFTLVEEELPSGTTGRSYLKEPFEKKWFRNYARINECTVGWVLNDN